MSRILETASQVTALGVCIILVLFLILAHYIRNIYFHPLSRYPGPKLWASSRLPWAWSQHKGRLSKRISELHDCYGPVVRVAPDELSYVTEGAWRTIYGPRPIEMPRDPNFKLNTPNGVQNIMVADRETHSRQRRVLSHAFSEKALREQEPVLQMYCDVLCERLQENCETGAVDMSEWFTFASFDLTGHLAFGESFGCLESETAHPFVHALKSGSRELVMGQIMKYYGIPTLGSLLSLLGERGVAGSRAVNMRSATETVKSRISRGPTADRKDIWHYVLEHLKEHGDAIGSKVAMTEPEMHANAFSIVGAGSEGPATALAGAVYLLGKHPEIYNELALEIRGTFADVSAITLQSITANLPLLTAVLKETMRLYPAVAITLPRQVPGGGEVIEGQFVPGRYTVGVNHFACYRSKLNFDNPNVFRPGRWLGDEQPGCYQPFSYGPRNCLGKNLAWAEMRLILTRVLWQFDFELMDNEHNENWLDQTLWGFWRKPPLMCRLAKVER